MRLIRHLHKFLQGSTTRKQGKVIPHPIVWKFWLSAAELPAMRRSLAAYKSVDTIRCTPVTKHGATCIHVNVVLQPDRLATPNPMSDLSLADFERGDCGWSAAMAREFLQR